MSQGVVEETRPLPWVNNIVFAAKKNGGIRTCLDCTPANNVTTKYDWPLPRLQDVRHRLRGASWFTRLDLADAFFRFHVPVEHRDLLAYRLNGRTYRFTRMPFGVTNGPAFFQKFMDHVLAAHFLYALWYLDDVLIFARDCVNLRSRTAAVKTELLRAGCTVNEDKSEYEKQSLLFAGLWFTPTSMGPNKAKVAELLALPAPVTKVDRQSALGLVSYLRDFIPFASLLTASIHVSARDLATQADCSKEWGNLLRHVSRFATTVGEWDDDGDAELYTDASKVGCGAILIQKGKIIAIVSRKFTKTELGSYYDTTARESLGLLLGASRFRLFLHRPRGVTRVLSDHAALLNRKLTEMTPREVRWHWKITQWVSNLSHVPGKENPADYISRWGLSQFGGRIQV